VNRGATIAALSACGVAGLVAAVLLTTAPGAGADDGTTAATTTSTGPIVTAPSTTAAPTTTAPTTTVPTTTTKPLPPSPKLITAGVTIGKTLVGGLTVSEARVLVKERFARPLTLVAGPGARAVATPAELGAKPELEAALALAARVKRTGFAVPLKVEVSTPKVERLVASLAERFQRDPVDATLKLRNLTPFATRDVPGRRLKELVAQRQVVLWLKTQQRTPLQLPFERIAPAMTEKAIGRAIVIRRGSNQLYLYRVGRTSKLVRRFGVATGRSQYPTPLGKFEIVNMQRDPWWYPPAGSDWAKDAEPVPPGPGNPLGTRWMGISSPYVGIHGTPDAASIGYSASHGCIRMLIPEVEWLFTQVEVGTPVFIVAA
jgi:lipoprotein-anchoring transpeptidase ErfK/SrfK